MADNILVLDHPENDDHEQVVFCQDKDSGLKALIAIHNTALGPALGGTRMWPYDSEADALTDVLRLSAGMTWKNAVANLDLGGGKAVIIGNSRTDKTKELFASFASFIERLNGAYITAEDVGITQADMDLVAEVTDHVSGISKRGLGDPSPFTAWGVFKAIEATAKHRLGTTSLSGLTIAIQGVGHVGGPVAKYLNGAGARLIITDIHADTTQNIASETGATVVTPDEILGVEADILVPCALGGILNEKTIPDLKVSAIAGAANNQLHGPDDADRLKDRGILYAPDYVVNAGGVISLGDVDKYPTAEAMNDRVAELAITLATIFERADAEEATTASVADTIARERVAAASS